MTGAGTAATLGYPDFGLVTMSEMVDNAGRIAAAVDLPVIADADTGYGNELNVVAHRARIRDSAGSPASISRTRASRRNAAISTTRRSCRARIGWPRSAPPSPPGAAPISSIIARTNSRAVAGFDEAIARANAALAAGADMVFVEAPQTLEEVAAVPRLVNGPCLLNVVRGGKTPELDFAEAERMGYKLAIVPGLLFKSVIGVCEQALAELKIDRPPPAAAQGDDGARGLPDLGRRRMGRAAQPLPRAGGEARRCRVSVSPQRAAYSMAR